MAAYNFTIKLSPWGESPELGNVGIDPSALYGYWDQKDGSEGGGLWFELLADGRLDLTDYDGDYCLPRSVIAAMRNAGISVTPDFE